MLFDYARVEPAVSNLLLVSYPFGLYSSTVLTGVQPANASLENTLGWNVVIKWVISHVSQYYPTAHLGVYSLFYIPGRINIFKLDIGCF